MRFLLETERLLLRPLAFEDADELVAMQRDPELIRFLGPLSQQEARRRLEASAEEWRELGYGRAAAIERASGRFVGRVGLKRWPQFGETELGWALRRDAWGRGYATEAARAWLDWASANVDVPYITAMIEPANAHSLGVAERLGMTKLRDDVLFGRDVIVFAVHRRDAGFLSP
jgi:RimJ/RimL family protein N-acetyltransferase